MKNFNLAIIIIGLLFSSSCLTLEEKEPVRILFIGNSILFYNQEVPLLVKELCPGVEVETSYFGGAKLYDHWRFDTALIKIRKSKWDYVVLQESSWVPSVEPETTMEYVEKFDEEIKKAGGETLLFMTAPYHASLWFPEGDEQFAINKMNDMAEKTFQVYRNLGEKINAAAVIPVGMAALKYMGFDGTQVPGMELYHPDKAHPSETGTLLSALTLAKSLGLEINASVLEKYLDSEDTMMSVVEEIVESDPMYQIRTK